MDKIDLAVDCIDRQVTLDAIFKRLGIKNEKYLLEAERAIQIIDKYKAESEG